jgi:hypothetical protein
MKRAAVIIMLLALSGYAAGQAVKFEFSSVRFRTGLASIEPQTYPALDSLAEFLKSSGARVEIAGHTDNVGGARSNLRLSQNRAEAVARYLVIRHRIPSGQLLAKGYGDMVPLVPNLTPDLRAQNRRVEITVLSRIRTARLSHLQGNVFARKQGISRWQPALADQLLTIQDEIVTDSTGRAEITFDNGARLKIAPSSNVLISRLSWDEKGASGEASVKLIAGRLLAKAGPLSPGESFEVATAAATAGINGAECLIEQGADLVSRLSVWENSVAWRGKGAAAASSIIPAGKGSLCLPGQAPQLAVELAQPPFPNYPAANDTFFYNPDRSRPMAFGWSKPSGARARLMLWLDPEQKEILLDRVVEGESLTVRAPKENKLYWWLTAIDSLGLEGQPWPSRVLNLSRKLDNPRLEIAAPAPDQKIASGQAMVVGISEPRATITIGGKVVSPAQDGSFKGPVTLSPGPNNITVTATDRAGNTTISSFAVVSAPFRRYELQPFGAGVKLLGGNFDDSDIGFIGGLKGGVSINNHYSIGITGAFAQLGATNFGTPAPDYLTDISIVGVWGRYHFAPGERITPYLSAEAGAMMWKNSHDGTVLYESNSPYFAAGPGIRFGLNPGISLLAEGKAGYFANRDPISGPSDVNNLKLTGTVGLGFGF